MSEKKATTNPFQGLTREQVLDAMRQLLAEETLNHYRMGQLYNYTVESKLMKGTQYKNALNYFSANFKEVSRTALLDYGAVARAFSEAVCARLGVTRLRLLVTYGTALKLELSHHEPDATPIQVPDEDGALKPKAFADCSVDELRKALLHLRSSDTNKPIDAEERALVDLYRDAVIARFPEGTPIRVQLRNPSGRTLIDFKGIPLAEVDKLTEALLDHLYPVREVPEQEAAPQVS